MTGVEQSADTMQGAGGPETFALTAGTIRLSSEYTVGSSVWTEEDSSLTLAVAIVTDLGLVVGADTEVTQISSPGMLKKPGHHCKVAVIEDWAAVATHGNTEAGSDLIRVLEELAILYPTPEDWKTHLQTALDTRIDQYWKPRIASDTVGLVIGLLTKSGPEVGNYRQDLGVSWGGWYRTGGNAHAMALTDVVFATHPYRGTTSHEAALLMLPTAIRLSGNMIHGVGTGFVLASITPEHATLLDETDARPLADEADHLAVTIQTAFDRVNPPETSQILPTRAFHEVRHPYYIRKATPNVQGLWDLIKAPGNQPQKVKRIMTLVYGDDVDKATQAATRWLERQRLI